MKEKKKIINEFNILGVNMQIVVTIAVLIFGGIYLFTKRFRSVFEILMAMDLFIMAYNNEMIYHKRKATVLYIIFGILLLVFAILSLVGVI